MKRKFFNMIYKRPFKSIIHKFIDRFEGGEFYSESIRYIYERKYNTSAGIGSYGCFNDKFNPFRAEIIIGKWCSIADGTTYIPGNHPKNDVSTHPIFHRAEYGFCPPRTFEPRKPLNIGNDVWIGMNVLIMPGCSDIGDGAIIGGGTVLTHDVEPYTIVAGNPGKVIGKRFDDDKIRLVEKSKWWDLDIHSLKEIVPYQEDIELFCKKATELHDR